MKQQAKEEGCGRMEMDRNGIAMDDGVSWKLKRTKRMMGGERFEMGAMNACLGSTKVQLHGLSWPAR